MASKSVLHGILCRVQQDIKDLELDGIGPDKIQVADINLGDENQRPGTPGVLIFPPPQGTETTRPGVNQKDDIGYPVTVGMFDAGENAASFDTERRDRNLFWRQRIRQKFLHQRLSVDVIGNADVYTCEFQANPIIDFAKMAQRCLWASGFTLRFWSREGRIA